MRVGAGNAVGNGIGVFGMAVPTVKAGGVNIVGATSSVSVGSTAGVEVDKSVTCSRLATSTGDDTVGRIAAPLPRSPKCCKGCGSRATYLLGIDLRMVGSCQKNTVVVTANAAVRILS